LIQLSTRVSLHFGSPVDVPVDSPVVASCWKLIRLSVRLSRVSRRLSYRLSYRLSWPFPQLGGSDANKHTRKVGHFHAAGELIRLSVHLSLRFGSPVDLPVVDCLNLIHLSARLSRMLCRLWRQLSYRLSHHDLQDVRWRLAAFNPAQVGAAEVSAR
jgi:hypothetical protein